MNEATLVQNLNEYSVFDGINNATINAVLSPFFSMRKLRTVYNELIGNQEFEFSNFDSFKQSVLSSSAPQLELSKWQAIAARR